MTLRTLLFLGITTLTFASALPGQRAPVDPFARRAPGELRVFMSTRWMYGVDVRFDNIGTVPGQAGVSGSPTGIRYQFDDGFIEVDAFSGDVTSNFGFRYDNATLNDQGFVDSFTLTRYSAESRGDFLLEEADLSAGIELGLQYLTRTYFNDRVRFGLIGGLGLNRLQTSMNSRVESDFYRQTATVLLSNTQITPSGEQTYIGGADGPVIYLGTGFFFDPEQRDQIVQELPGQGAVPVPALVDGLFEINGLSTGLRFGGTAEIRLLNSLLLEAGGGLSAVYLYSDLKISQTLSNTNLFDNVTLDGKSTDTEWFIGPYAEGRLSFDFNRVTRFYLGAQYMAAEETLTQEINGFESRILLNRPLWMQVGFNIRY